MAWTGLADFNGLSDADLNGQAGGTGWTGNWAADLGQSSVGDWDIAGTTVYEGAKAIVNSTSRASSGIDRVLSTDLTADGTVYFAMRRSTTTTFNFRMDFKRSDGNGCFGISMNSGGNITSSHQFGDATLVTGYLADTWYIFKVNLYPGSYTYDVYVYTGAYGGAGTLVGSTTGRAWAPQSGQANVHYFNITRDTVGAGSVFFDYISATSPFISGPANVKTLQGVAIASVKTLQGVAIASVKSSQGVV